MFCKPGRHTSILAEVTITPARLNPAQQRCARAGEGGESPQRRAGRSAESARPRHVRAKGGPVALTTVSQFLAAISARPSSRDTLGQEVPAMASSTRPSVSTADGVPETEKTSRESDNTYILRPIFQQRRVADGLWQGRSAGLWVRQAELAWQLGGREG